MDIKEWAESIVSRMENGGVNSLMTPLRLADGQLLIYGIFLMKVCGKRHPVYSITRDVDFRSMELEEWAEEVDKAILWQMEEKLDKATAPAEVSRAG